MNDRELTEDERRTQLLAGLITLMSYPNLAPVPDTISFNGLQASSISLHFHDRTKLDTWRALLLPDEPEATSRLKVIDDVHWCIVHAPGIPWHDVTLWLNSIEPVTPLIPVTTA